MMARSRTTPYQQRNSTGGTFLFYFGLTVATLLVLFGSYSLGMGNLTEDVATNAAQGSGLTDIEVGPARANFLYFECDKGDSAHREVSGTNAQGQRVEIIVCGGWLKAATVRYP